MKGSVFMWEGRGWSLTKEHKGIIKRGKCHAGMNHRAEMERREQVASGGEGRSAEASEASPSHWRTRGPWREQEEVSPSGQGRGPG